MLKKLFFLLLILLTIIDVIYASFPITEDNTGLTVQKLLIDEEEKEDGIKWGLLILVLSALGFGAFFLIRAWWRAWKDDIRWVKISTYILFGLLLLLLIIVVLDNTVGLVYNMQ